MLCRACQSWDLSGPVLRPHILVWHLCRTGFYTELALIPPSKFLFCLFWRLDYLKRWWCGVGWGLGEDRARNGRGRARNGRGGRGPGEERARPGEERGSARVREAKQENARVWRVWRRKPGKVKFTQTTPNILEKIRVSPRTISKIFSAVDTQTAVLVSTAKVWISAPDTQTSVLLGFLGIHRCFWVLPPFPNFSTAPVTKISVSGPAPYKKNPLSHQCRTKFGYFRSRPGKPNQRKGQNEKFMNFAHFCEFWCVSLGKQARFTLNFCSGMPLWKVHELTDLWLGLPGPPLSISDFRSKPQMFARNRRKPPWRP